MPKDIKKNEKKEKKEKKHFFRDFKAELKRVVWPTPKQLVNNTVAVITIVLLIAIIVFVLDFAFESMNNYGINKLKEIVGNNETTNNTTNNVNNETANNAINNITNNTTTTNEEASNNTANE